VAEGSSEAGSVGRIRPARRPAGWIAPGPPPLAPRDRPEVWPRAGEDLCHLAGDWRILQRRGGHRWSLDDLVTAWFAAERVATPPRRVLDLGCGIGTVLLLLAWRFPEARGRGIEAQAPSAALARRSLAWNGADARFEIVTGDLRDARATDDADLVTGTPPYLPPGTATAPADGERWHCHTEHRGGIEDYCLAAARALTPGGLFATCAGALQADRVTHAAAAAGLAIEARRDVVPREGKGVLFAVYALRRAAGAAAPVMLPALVVRDREGRWTPEFRDLRRTMGMPILFCPRSAAPRDGRRPAK
jgi:tRNA1(Val) A37 N6-methylase TrmN6